MAACGPNKHQNTRRTNNYDDAALAADALTVLWNFLSKVLISSMDCAALAVEASFCSSSATSAFSLKNQPSASANCKPYRKSQHNICCHKLLYMTFTTAKQGYEIPRPESIRATTTAKWQWYYSVLLLIMMHQNMKIVVTMTCPDSF